jgi:hypothetical protein
MAINKDWTELVQRDDKETSIKRQNPGPPQILNNNNNNNNNNTVDIGWV